MYFFLFETIHDVLRAEKVLKAKGCAHELVPVPRVLSSDCGVCIRSEKGGKEIMHLLSGVSVDKCFLLEEDRFIPIRLEAAQDTDTKRCADEACR